MEYLPFLYELTVCFLLSFLIGFERQYRRRAVGLRTIILVSVGSFLFVTFSKAYPGSDMNRIASQVVAGIGFLGAGVIIKDDKSVKGLTTAATLWCAAAIGILCGANLLIEAAIGTVVILFINIVLRNVNAKINNLVNNKEYDIFYFKIICDNNYEDEILKIIKNIATKTEAKIINIKIEDESDDTSTINFCIANTSKVSDLTNRIMQKLSHRDDIKSINLDKKITKNILDDEEL